MLTKQPEMDSVQRKNKHGFSDHFLHYDLQAIGLQYHWDPWAFAMGPRSNANMPETTLVGGFNPLERYQSKLIISPSPSRGETKKCLEPPPGTVCCKSSRPNKVAGL